MLDAVQNHSARVIVVDELRDSREVDAAKTIANQGVVLLASVHACTLTQLAHNLTLNGQDDGGCKVFPGRKDEAPGRDSENNASVSEIQA